MALPLQKFREMVFQMLFCCEFSSSEEADVAAMLMHELKVPKKVALEAYQRVQTVMERFPEIDEKISQASTEYQFERISRIEKNILRLGLFELFYDETVPWKVAIAEAIRLCRKFGTPESAHFVNAILDSIYKGSSSCPSMSTSLAENS